MIKTRSNVTWLSWAVPALVIGIMAFPALMNMGLKEKVRQCLEENWQTNGQDHRYLSEVVSDTRGGSFRNGTTLHYIEYRTRDDDRIKTTTCGWDW